MVAIFETSTTGMSCPLTIGALNRASLNPCFWGGKVMGGGSCLAMNALSEDFERHAHTCQSFSFHYALTCTDGEDGDIYIYIYIYCVCISYLH